MNIAFVGLSGVPYLRRASDNRLMTFAELFTSVGYQVYVINRYPLVSYNKYFALEYNQKIKIIESLRNTSGLFNKLNFLIKIYSFFAEFYQIIKLHKKEKINILHVYSGHYLEFVFYKFISKIIHSKLIYQYVEYRSKIERIGIYHKYNGRLVDSQAHKVFDGIICISSFLENEIRKKTKVLPTIKIPPLTDFDFFNNVEKKMPDTPFLLFCGAAGYKEVISFIIDSYNMSIAKNNGLRLILVLNGSSQEINTIENYIGAYNTISILTNLPYSVLIQYYKSAFALLIPLRNTFQDIARFPNKIGEYCASKNIIITTNNGEIPYYFKDSYNAVIAEDYSVKSYANKINWCMQNGNKLNKIRKEAYVTGEKYFNIKSYKNEIITFLKLIG